MTLLLGSHEPLGPGGFFSSLDDLGLQVRVGAEQHGLPLLSITYFVICMIFGWARPHNME